MEWLVFQNFRLGGLFSDNGFKSWRLDNIAGEEVREHGAGGETEEDAFTPRASLARVVSKKLQEVSVLFRREQ